MRNSYTTMGEPRKYFVKLFDFRIYNDNPFTESSDSEERQWL